MRKLLNNPWFVGLMAVVALALVLRGVFSRDGTSGAQVIVTTEDTAAGDEAGENAAVRSPYAVVKALVVPAEVRDPFAVRVEVGTVEKEPEPDLIDTVHLSALWTQDGQTLVVINDRICQNGDEIGRIKIESATQDGVWLSHWRGRDFVSIGGNFSLATPSARSPGIVRSL